MAQEVLTLGGGCFWCLEAVFDQMAGIENIESGYMGGPLPNPTYRDVCTGKSGHAEVVRLTYDNEVVTTRSILEVFFAIHDPTTRNRQGNDVGTQYRSAIFFHSPGQESAARALVKKLDHEKLFSRPIVTEIAPAGEFHIAEDGHQEYFRRVGRGNPYCSYVIEPKVSKFRKQYMERLKR